jgi:CheY-like chemotaxis protein
VARKLFLADDSPTIQRVIELTFAGEDIQVVTVGDGEQAIARIPQERPDIVLADIGMPKRSGYEVAAFVKGHPDLKHIPVLLLFGAFEPVDNVKAQEAGCDGVLVKPFEPQHVIARVHELIDGMKGSPTQAAAATVARPVDRLTPGAPRVELLPPAPATEAREDISDAGVDDYFDRLDAAFATRQSPPPVVVEKREADLEVPTLDAVLSKPAPPIDLPVTPPPAAVTPRPQPVAPPPVEPPETPATLAPQPAKAHAEVVAGFSRPAKSDGSDRKILADAFTALLAVEAGEPGAKPVRLTTGSEEPAVTDALVDEVLRRVLQRLAPDAARDAVVQVVSEVAERLVREEIARIRGK